MKPRKHAELIKAWADGAEIESLFGDSWEEIENPHWFEEQKYRIKPPKKSAGQVLYEASTSARLLPWKEIGIDNQDHYESWANKFEYERNKENE
jgi:hypothetical protein